MEISRFDVAVSCTRSRTLSRVLRRLLAALLVLVVLALGAWIGGRHPGWLPSPLRGTIAGDQSTAVVREAIDRIHADYYREIPRDALADDAIAGIVSRLDDRFSNYFDPAEYRRFRLAQSSAFTGVGMTVAEADSGLRVQSVFDGSPAKRAGIVPGDVIVAAGGRPLRGVKQDAAIALVKGPAGSEVRLTWIHDGRRVTKTVSRATVTVPVVASRLRGSGSCRVGVVALSQFSSGAHAEVYAAIRKLRDQGAKAFVFDLRDNGGGLVTEARLVASAFLERGPIVTTRGRNVPEQTLRATGSPVYASGPLAVLVNKNTASASEIVTGALQDRDRATVVGARTFGKGVFQEVVELSNGGALDITAGQYFTPKGRNLGGRGVATGAGISPDVRADDDPDTAGDEALDRAERVVLPKCPA